MSNEEKNSIYATGEKLIMISHVFLSANPTLFVKSITGLESDEK